jgi:hypothetical protein
MEPSTRAAVIIGICPDFPEDDYTLDLHVPCAGTDTCQSVIVEESPVDRAEGTDARTPAPA